MNRREFLEAGALGLGSLVVGPKPMQPLSSGGASEVSNWVSEPEIGGLIGSKVDEYIGGWAIGGTTLIHEGGTAATSAGLAPNDYPFYAGAAYADRATAPYRVTTAGALVATSATITGAITATSGSFTGTINATAGYFGSSANGVNIDATGVTLAGTGHISTATSGARVEMLLAGIKWYDATTQRGQILNDGSGWLGSSTAFAWTTAGAVTMAAGATIGGFDIGDDYIRDVADSMGLASTVTGGDDVRFWAGATFANRATAPARITEAGVATFTSATITGAITATSGSFTGSITSTSGTIGGWTLGATTLTGGGVTLDSAGAVTIATSGSATYSLQWLNGGNRRAGVAVSRDASDNVDMDIMVTSGAVDKRIDLIIGTDSASNVGGVAFARTQMGSTLDFNIAQTTPAARTMLQLRYDNVADSGFLKISGYFYPGSATSTQDTRYLYDTGATSGLAIAGGPFSTTGYIYPGTGSALQTARYLYDTGTYTGFSGSSATATGIALFNTHATSEKTEIRFGRASGDWYVGSDYAADGTNDFFIYGNSALRAYINSAGLLTAYGGLSVIGGQIAFPATQVPSSGANVLDDYEEQSWTPSVGGTATYTAQVGRYIKIGKLVFVYCDIQINVLGTGSTTIISGLPFANLAGPTVNLGSVTYYSNLATSVVYLVPIVNDGTTTVKFESNAASATTMTDTTVVFANSTRIVWAAIYEAGA